jgi:hypothetical protein
LHDAAVLLLDRAIEALRRDADERAVHTARRSCKHLRAALRLLRAGMGQREYRRDNLRVRDSARPLTAVRDAVMLRRTLGRLSRHAPSLQCDLELDYHRAWRVLESRGAQTALARLKAIRARLRKLPRVDSETASAISGAKQVYKAGRRALHIARSRDDHDLSVLAGRLRAGGADDRHLRKRITKRRRKLQARAFREGKRLYRHSARHIEATLVAHLSNAQRASKSAH